VATHPCFGGSVIVEKEATTSPARRHRAAQCVRQRGSAQRPEVVSMTVVFAATGSWPRCLTWVCENLGIISLEEAEIIVAGGRGVGSAEKFTVIRELAEALAPRSAPAGPSSTRVDQPSVPGGTDRQDRLAQALHCCGISGAIQHAAGMQTSDYIVAINRDPEAPIFSFADFGVVGDLHVVVPALTEEIRRRKAAS